MKIFFSFISLCSTVSRSGCGSVVRGYKGAKIRGEKIFQEQGKIGVMEKKKENSMIWPNIGLN